MKRSAIARKTPMGRGTSRLARSGPLRFRSPAMERVYRTQRRPLVARLLEERPWCELRVEGVCTGRAETVHEIVKRSAGGSIVDEANCRATCCRCNTWVEDHPKRAQRLGLSSSFATRAETDPSKTGNGGVCVARNACTSSTGGDPTRGGSARGANRVQALTVAPEETQERRLTATITKAAP